MLKTTLKTSAVRLNESIEEVNKPFRTPKFPYLADLGGGKFSVTYKYHPKDREGKYGKQILEISYK